MIKHNTQYGFTLTELMIVITIVGILVSIATPAMIDTIRKNQLNSEVREIASIIKDVRSEAVLLRRSKSVDWASGADGSVQSKLKYTEVSSQPTLTFGLMGALEMNGNRAMSDVCVVVNHKSNSGFSSAIKIRNTGNIEIQKGNASCV